MRVVVLLVIPALLFAGCLDRIKAPFDGDEEPVAPAPITYAGTVGPGFNKTETFSVPPGMGSIAVALNLSFAGAPDPRFPAIAQVDFTLTGPSGTSEKRTLNPQKLKDTIGVTGPAAGAWTLKIAGNGLGGQNMGATYQAVVVMAT